jgi:hypothetical protein
MRLQPIPPIFSLGDIQSFGYFHYSSFAILSFRTANVRANWLITQHLNGGRLTNRPPGATFSTKTGTDQLIFYQNNPINLFLTDIG